MHRRDFYKSLFVLCIVGICWLGGALLFSGSVPYFCCPFRAITGIPCPGCGLTHACLLMLRGDVKAALEANVLVVLLPGVLLIPLAVYDVACHRSNVFGVYTFVNNTAVGRLVLICLAALVIGSWLSRIL